MAQDLDIETTRGRLRVHRFDPIGDVPVICIPGLSSNSRVFDALGEYRQSRGRGTIALDLRGRGWSEVTGPGTYGWINHGLDVFEVADALGIHEFDLVGHSMGAFISMQATTMDIDRRVRRVVLIDGLGIPTQRALGAIVAGVGRLGGVFASADAYVDAVRSAGLAAPWNAYWDRHYRYDLIDVEGGVRPRTDAAAVGEDAAFGATHSLLDLWPFVRRPVLLLRATVPLGGPDGFVVTPQDFRHFQDVHPESVRPAEIEANHFGIAVDPRALAAIDTFLTDTVVP
jgi:pimeloyl-ACP methyl ester carboxylesterase